MAQALLAKAIDVQMEDPAVAKITVEKLKGRTVISSNELIYPVVIGLAVRKDNQALLEKLTTAFAQIKQNGSYGELLARYNLAEPSAEEIRAAPGTTTPLRHRYRARPIADPTIFSCLRKDHSNVE